MIGGLMQSPNCSDDDLPPPPPFRRSGIVESQYTAAMGAAIMARLWAGWSVKRLVADPDMPSRATFYMWLRLHGDLFVPYQAWRTAQMQDAARRDADRRAATWWRKGIVGAGAGRSRYRTDIGQAICDRLVAGEPLYKIARDPAMPGLKTICRWLTAHPDFADMYRLARELQADILADRAAEVAEGVKPWTLAGDRRRVSRLQGQAGRMTPRKYGVAPRPQLGRGGARFVGGTKRKTARDMARDEGDWGAVSEAD